MEKVIHKTGLNCKKNMYSLVFRIVAIVFCIGLVHTASGQIRRTEQSAVTYEELFDDPYDLNTLFVHFQPLYMELFVANVNAGFGLQVEYSHKDKLTFMAHARKTYAKETDFARQNALKNSDVDNAPAVYNYYEFGATYHIKDWEEDTQSKVILYSTRYKGRRWAANVPEHIIIPTKVRKIYGARLGGLIYDTSTDITRVMEKQEVTLPQVINPEVTIPTDTKIYGNVDVAGVYVGGSMSWIKNFAIKPDRNYATLGDDLIFTTYLDIIIAPWVTVPNIFHQNIEYSTEDIATNMLGVRGGMQGKFNREWGWSYGAEMGFRPGVKTKGFYALLKVSFPVFSTSMDYRKEAFSK